MKERQEVWDAGDEGERQRILQAAYDNAIEEELAVREEWISALEKERTEENARLIKKLVSLATSGIEEDVMCNEETLIDRTVAKFRIADRAGGDTNEVYTV